MRMVLCDRELVTSLLVRILAIHVAKAISPVHGFHLARRGHPRLRRSTPWILGGKNNPKMKPRIK